MRIKSYLVFLSVISIFFLTAIPSTFAVVLVDSNDTRESLKELSGVRVVVHLDNEFEKVGLTEDQVKNDVELKLRLAGINVASNDGVTKIPEMPKLIITVFGHIVPDRKVDAIFAFIEAELVQPVYLGRALATNVLASTWSSSYLLWGSKKDTTTIRNNIKDRVDSFINAYLSVNPKGGK